MGKRKAHSKKEVKKAIRYAIDRGWLVKGGGSHSHVWGVLYCPAGDREGCKISVYGTPVNPKGTAERIIEYVDACNCLERQERERDEQV